VGLQQGELAALAKVSRKTLTDFEKGVRQPYERTIRDIREALEHAGVVFLSADDFGGAGVRLARFS
jgi:transcriptional regulator with XRE-family HTH domain